MSIFRKQSPWDRVSKPLSKVDGRSIARSGLTAGATVLVLSAASAATSVVRRKREQP
jgi:hypothetical protein